MVVSIEQINNGISKYVENEIAYKSSGLNKFLLYMFIPSIPNKINTYINENRSMLSQYFDDNGNVIIDKLYHDSKQAMQKTLQVEISGIIFKENDIDMIYKYITE